jgi:hypothetical protein
MSVSELRELRNSVDVFIMVDFDKAIITNRRILEQMNIYDKLSEELEKYGVELKLVKHLQECPDFP